METQSISDSRVVLLGQLKVAPLANGELKQNAARTGLKTDFNAGWNLVVGIISASKKGWKRRQCLCRDESIKRVRKRDQEPCVRAA